MQTVDILGQLAAGVRMGLALLAVMVLFSPAPKGADATLPMRLIALAAVSFSPFRAAYLLDAEWLSLIAKRLGDITASSLACAAMIIIMARWSRQRGVKERQVRRGVVANIMIVAAMCSAAFL